MSCSLPPFCRKLVCQDRNHWSRASNPLLAVIPAPVYFWREHIFASLQELCGVLAPLSIRRQPRQAVPLSHTRDMTPAFRREREGRTVSGLPSPTPILSLLVLHILRLFLFKKKKKQVWVTLPGTKSAKIGNRLPSRCLGAVPLNFRSGAM